MGAAASTEGGIIHSDAHQLWCSQCKQKFVDPRRLPCGHMVCGTESPLRCANRTLGLPSRKCPVKTCQMPVKNTVQLEDLEVPEIRGDEAFLSESYRKILRERNSGPLSFSSNSG